MAIVLPSILSCDFANIARQMAQVEAAGANIFHIDVMDGHFVPNITFGPPVVKSLRAVTRAFFDVHLMVKHPQRFIKPFVQAGANHITIHIECADDIGECLDLIRNSGITAGISLRPDTPAAAVFPYLDKLKVVLIMTVQPGFGGQSMIISTLDKIDQIKTEAARRGLGSLEYEIDGGINSGNIAFAAQRGATWIVTGSAIFERDDPAAAYQSLSQKILDIPAKA